MPSLPRFARYQVLGRLATGGMAEVWLGRSVGFGGFEKLVVLKTILPNLLDNAQFVQMFVNEARVAAMLNHPNCVQIFELGKEDGQLFIAMEYIEGFALSRVLKRAKARGQRMPVEILVRVVADTLSGLDHAHRLADREGRPMGLIHRDVSPDNLLLSFSGQTKVVDFGVAKAERITMGTTRAGTVKGKFGYIAPEYLRGERIDGRADLFALGVVLYRALTGKRPFGGANEAAVTMAVLKDTPIPPSTVVPNLPAGLSDVVMMALDKNPEGRFENARTMRQALEAAVRPADADEVAAFLATLWPPGDPERVALESLAAGKAEENSDPALESVVSQSTELPRGMQATPQRFAASVPATPVMLPPPVLAAEPPTSPELPPEPPTVMDPRRAALVPTPAAHGDEDDDEPTPSAFRRFGPVLLVLALAVAGGLAYRAWRASRAPVEPPAPLAVQPVPAAPPTAPVPEPAPPAAPTGPGHVEVSVEQPVTVLLGETELGKSPGPFDLEPGPKTLRLVNKALGIDQTFEVEVKAGEPLSFTGPLRKGTLALNIRPWAYVKLDGRTLGQTPLGRRELFEGPHSLELTNSELNVTRRLEVRIVGGETKNLSLNLE